MNAIKAQRVLIADDNEDVRELVGIALDGYRLSFADDGEQALESVRRQQPDLVVLDIMMPRMDGFAFLEAIQRDETVRFLKVVVLSAKTMKDDMLKGFSLGAIDYLTKPFRTDVLRAKVDRLVQMRFAEEVAAYQRMVWRFLNHHLRNGLNVMAISNSILRTGEGSGASRSSLDMMSAAIDEMTHLVEQGTFLNDLASSPVWLAPVNLCRVVEDGVSEARGRALAAGGRRIDLVLPDADERPCLVAGNEPLLRRAMRSVLIAAIQRTCGGDGIAVTVRQHMSDFRIEVTDRGAPLSRAIRDRLFTPFNCEWTDLPAAHGVPSGGIGLDLPIAHLTARLCGGDLSVDSHRGTTTFTFTLPLANTRATLAMAG